MGALNSSKTRVAPVFSQLFARDPSGKSWVRQLLSLGARSGTSVIPTDLGTLLSDKHPSWGDKEKPLAPPKSLLEHLVDTVSEQQVEASGDSGTTLENRRKLSRNEEGMREAALEKISRLPLNRRTPRTWYIFEGDSFPDACLQTDKAIIVIEGKRTEPMCTTKTKWMPNRSQLLRHMDAALEIAGDRLVYGLLIVEDSDKKSLREWEIELDLQLAPRNVEESLPHRTESERRKILGGVLGVASWQSVCSEFGLPFPPDK